MKVRHLLPLACATAIFALVGCERPDMTPFAAELDEPGYRRAKELLRQGRNQQALSEFQKVIEKRGLGNSPETHLELVLLYHQHIRDPIAAIYHFRKFRELRPTSPQSDLVRQRIEAAMRDFARTLPGQPLDNPSGPLDEGDTVRRLQRENDQLRAALGQARVAAGFSPQVPTDTAGNISLALQGDEVPAYDPAEENPVSASPTESQIYGTSESAPQAGEGSVGSTGGTGLISFGKPPEEAGGAVAAPSPTPAPTGRRHVVKAKESLYSIARQYYGSPTNARVEALYQANRHQLSSKTDLKVGMELVIP